MRTNHFVFLKSSFRLPTILAAVLLLAPVAQAQFYEWSAGPLQASKLSTVAFKGWLPERSEPLRGTLLLIPGRHGGKQQDGCQDDGREFQGFQENKVVRAHFRMWSYHCIRNPDEWKEKRPARSWILL